MSTTTICAAIRSRNLITFQYTGDTTPGQRTVEPHMLAYNSLNHLSLSGWFTGGTTESGGQGWREYLVDAISDVQVLPQTFATPRPGYQPTGGKKFHNVQCAV